MLWLVAGGACGVSPNWGTHPVTTAEISDGAVTSVKIAHHAVGQEQIAPGAVTTSAIAFGAIGASQLGTNSVGPGQLQPRSVIDVNLADGVVVRQVLPGSPAERAGLRNIQTGRRGQVTGFDLITEIAGRRVTRTAELLDVLDDYEAGDVVKVRFVRAGNTWEANIELALID